MGSEDYTRVCVCEECVCVCVSGVCVYISIDGWVDDSGRKIVTNCN